MCIWIIIIYLCVKDFIISSGLSPFQLLHVCTNYQSFILLYQISFTIFFRNRWTKFYLMLFWDIKIVYLNENMLTVGKLISSVEHVLCRHNINEMIDENKTLMYNFQISFNLKNSISFLFVINDNLKLELNILSTLYYNCNFKEI